MVGIGFFAPFPLALMVPFMAGQSLAMGEAFGKGFQYGKRKISSMSNEEFNLLDFRKLSESINTDYKVMIPSLKNSIQASDELQREVFKALGDVIKDIPGEILKFFQDVTTPTNTSGSGNQSSTEHLILASELGTLHQVRSGGGLGQSDGGVTVNEQALEDLGLTAEEIRKYIASLLDPFAGGGVKKQREKEALARQIENRRKQEALQRTADARVKQALIEKQRAREKPALTVKRLAGQSQRLELSKLQTRMRQLALQLIGWKRSLIGPPRKPHLSSTISRGNLEMRTLQIKVERLMANYRFA